MLKVLVTLFHIAQITFLNIAVLLESLFLCTNLENIRYIFLTLWGPLHTYLDIFESVTCSFWIIQIEFACSHASDGIRIHSRETWLLTLCRHIGLLLCKKLDTILLRIGFAVHPLSDSLRIYFFPLRRAD